MSVTSHLTYRIVPLQTALSAPGPIIVFAGKCLRWLLKRGFGRFDRKRQRRATESGQELPRWRILNNRLQERLALPYLMLNAPRWNTHAQVLTAGPFRHEGGPLRFDGLKGQNWSSWSLVVYEAASSRTVDFFSSGRKLKEIELSPGVYGTGLRVYDADGAINLPEMSATAPVIPSETLMALDSNALESQIFGKTSRFYRLLNAPVMRQLATTCGGEDADLAQAFLPVGNPETLFIFGSISGGSTIRISAEAVPQSVRCYLTTYNTASFPISSLTIPVGQETACPGTEDGSFLIRILPSVGSAQENLNLLDKIQVEICSST